MQIQKRPRIHAEVKYDVGRISEEFQCWESKVHSAAASESVEHTIRDGWKAKAEGWIGATQKVKPRPDSATAKCKFGTAPSQSPRPQFSELESHWYWNRWWNLDAGIRQITEPLQSQNRRYQIRKANWFWSECWRVEGNLQGEWCGN